MRHGWSAVLMKTEDRKLFYMIVWIKWGWQVPDLPPESHPGRRFMHRLRPVLVIGSQRIGSSETISRQQESGFEYWYCFWGSKPCCKICFLMELKISRLISLTEGGMLFQNEGSDRLCHCWYLPCKCGTWVLSRVLL